MTEKEMNEAIEAEVQDLVSAGVPEWQARETAAINLGLVRGDIVEVDTPSRK